MSVPLQSAATIEPFWNRLPKIMFYPANGAAMAMIVMMAVARLVVFLPFAGWILAIMSLVAMYRFAFVCLQATADGFMTPPEITTNVDRSVARKYIWLVLILVFVAGFAFAVFGKVIGIGLAIFLGLSLPGATMTLAMEESLSSALNPLKWLAIFGAIGWPYLAVVGLCLAISGSEGFANNVVKNIMPPAAALVVIGVISNYALVMTFHLMGYLLYQYHEELGFTPTAPELNRPEVKADPDQQLLDEAATLVRDGKHEEAAARLKGRLRAGASPAVHAQYRKLLRVAGDRQALLDHGHEFVAILIDQDNDKAAVELLRDCQAIDPSFSPDTAVRAAKLAHMAARAGQSKAAVQLLEGFHERFPKTQYLAQCYLLAAELLHEHLGQDEKACELLRIVKANAPEDPLIPEVDAKLQAIERMIAATATRPRPAHS